MPDQSAVPLRHEPLKPREKQVLISLSEGKTYAEIARSMHITERTARHYATRARERHGLVNNMSMVCHAIRQGWI